MHVQWTRERILELAGSYKKSCVLAAAADWDVFTALSPLPSTAESLAAQLGTDGRATAMLLDALVAMGLLDKSGDSYSVPAAVAESLSAAHPDNVLPMVRHQANCLRRWVQLPNLLKTGGPAERLPSVRGEEDDQAAFIGAMHNVSAPIAETLVNEVVTGTFNHVLDVGGASGTWTLALLKRVPTATATLFDLPDVIPMARARFEEASVTDRVTLVAGDYHTDELPAGADLVWLSAIAHQNAREQNRALFRKIHDALAPGGSLLLRDIVMNETRTRPPSGAMFAINMLVGTEGGGTYTFEEYRDDLQSAGFSEVQLRREDEWMDAVVQADKDSA